MGGDTTDKLIRDAEKLRADLLKLASAVEVWTAELAASSGLLREGNDDYSGESGAGPGARGQTDQGSASTE